MSIDIILSKIIEVYLKICRIKKYLKKLLPAEKANLLKGRGAKLPI